MNKILKYFVIFTGVIGVILLGIRLNVPGLKSSGESSDFVMQVRRDRQENQTPFMKLEELIQTVELGDAIECWRRAAAWMYSHWAIYVGEKEVIDVQSNFKTGLVEIRKTTLETMMGGDSCRVNNLIPSAERRGLKRLPKLHVLGQAFKELDRFNKQEALYSITDFNCEHFATLCLYGKPFSDQADNVVSKPSVCRATSLLGIFQTFYRSFKLN